MEDDIITCLTRQVQEDVIENYLRERRLIDEQLDYLEELAQKTLKKARKTGSRLSRIGYLMVDDHFRDKWAEIVRLPKESYWYQALTEQFKGNARFIQVTALTHKGRFKKLVHEAYRRLVQRMDEYKKLYEDLKKEIEAVNLNIKAFHRNFDILAIIQFLKSLDVCTLERKKFLGENFTPEELMEIDKSLYFKPASLSKWNIPEPFELPLHEHIERPLDQLISQVYERYGWHLKKIVK